MTPSEAAGFIILGFGSAMTIVISTLTFVTIMKGVKNIAHDEN